jgi:hypothetical protein
VDEQSAAGCVQLPFTSVNGVGDVTAYPDQFTLVLFVEPLIRGPWDADEAAPPVAALTATKAAHATSTRNDFT